jgi:uncharacterized protein YaaN involved in tellurite resistance
MTEPAATDLAIVTDVPGLEVIPAGRRAELTELARTKVAELMTNPTDRDRIDEICRVGLQAETATRKSYELLNQKVRDSLHDLQSGDGVSSGIIRDMTNLRALTAPMDAFATNPSRLERALSSRLFGWFPGANLVADKLRKIAAYYESHQDQMNALIRSVEGGRNRLVALNDENKLFRDQLLVDIENLTANLFLAEAVKAEVEEQIKTFPEGARRRQLQGWLLIITKRVEAIAQAITMTEMDLAAIETRINDNEIWYQKLGNQLTVGPRLLEAAVFIQLNILESDKIAAASEAWDRLIGAAMVANAKATHVAHTRTMNAYARGIVTMEQMAAAQAEFVKMFEEEEATRRRLLETANRNILLAEQSAAEFRSRRIGNEAIGSGAIDGSTSTIASLEA